MAIDAGMPPPSGTRTKDGPAKRQAERLGAILLDGTQWHWSSKVDRRAAIKTIDRPTGA
jgi:hypothetical protein